MSSAALLSPPSFASSSDQTLAQAEARIRAARKFQKSLLSASAPVPAPINKRRRLQKNPDAAVCTAAASRQPAAAADDDDDNILMSEAEMKAAMDRAAPAAAKKAAVNYAEESSSGGSPSEESEEDGESGESDDDNESDDDGGDSFHDDIESERQESLDPYVRLGLKAPLPPAPLLTAAAALGARLQGCSEQKRPSWSSAHLQEEEVEAERKANDVSLAALESKQPLDSHLRGGSAVATAAAEKAEPQQPRASAPEEQRQRVAPAEPRPTSVGASRPSAASSTSTPPFADPKFARRPQQQGPSRLSALMPKSQRGGHDPIRGTALKPGHGTTQPAAQTTAAAAAMKLPTPLRSAGPPSGTGAALYAHKHRPSRQFLATGAALAMPTGGAEELD